MIFTDFKSNSKVWMYVSQELIDKLTQKEISDQFLNFTNTWKSHGDQVYGKLKFINDYVVIIGADILGNIVFSLVSPVIHVVFF